MRYIPLHESNPPDQAWLDKAVRALGEVSAETDVKKRNEIIDKHQKVWGELKARLLGLSHQKCWFSEAKDCFSHFDVEHFRPKKSAKDIDGKEVDGYWWLAFDWKNLRICGNVGNRTKSTYFPLKEGCTRCSPNGDLRREVPLLLDPSDPDDCALLTFDVMGEVKPAAHLQDDWSKERVNYSVQRFNLTFRPLTDKRKLVWSDCWCSISQYIDDVNYVTVDPNNETARQSAKESAKRIRKMLQPEAELSAVARACVLNSGNDRVIALLQGL